MEEQRRTDRIVEELQRLKGQGRAAAVEEERSKFVIFTLRDGRYAFAGADIKEILPAMAVFPVPGAPRSVPGVINNRGDIEAVVDLCGFLGLPDSGGPAGGRIMMTEKAGVRFGMLVDSVVDVVDLPPSSIKPPLATLNTAAADLVVGEMVSQGRSVVLLDLGRILESLRKHDR